MFYIFVVTISVQIALLVVRWIAILSAVYIEIRLKNSTA
jgi:hypothetical protein